MIVRLTHAQADAIMKRVRPEIVELMVECRQVYGKTQHDYLLPPLGWRQVLDTMVASCYGPYGGVQKGRGRPPQSALLAIRRVADCIRKIEGHPALREARAHGIHHDVVACWTVEDDAGRHYSPYPRWEDGSFWVMVPQPVTVHGATVTTWVRAAGTELELLQAQSRAYQREFHLLLGGEV